MITGGRFGDGARGRGLARAWMVALCLGHAASAMAAPADPGRLFFTPAQRAQLEAARAARPAGSQGSQAPVNAAAPLHYDGIVIRSDGVVTRWIDGKPKRDGAAVSGLKPGQIRADGQVYEPYQVLRPTPAAPVGPDAKEPVR
ncbi:MAG: hypothetical protein M0Z73_06550 [Betaproteobacteria bacterium]|nr:hypothetical protein [Betaproteobacteria bacterium]